jgi:hypothetical protein
MFWQLSSNVGKGAYALGVTVSDSCHVAQSLPPVACGGFRRLCCASQGLALADEGGLATRSRSEQLLTSVFAGGVRVSSHPGLGVADWAASRRILQQQTAMLVLETME